MKKLKHSPGFLFACACAALGLFILAVMLMLRPCGHQKADVDELFTTNCADLPITPYDTTATTTENGGMAQKQSGDGEAELGKATVTMQIPPDQGEEGIEHSTASVQQQPSTSCQTMRFYLGNCSRTGSAGGAKTIRDSYISNYDPQDGRYTNWKVVQINAADVPAAAALQDRLTRDQLTRNARNTVYLRIERKANAASGNFLNASLYPSALQQDAARYAQTTESMYFVPQSRPHWCTPFRVPDRVQGQATMNSSGNVMFTYVYDSSSQTWSVLRGTISLFNDVSRANPPVTNNDKFVMKLTKTGGWRMGDVLAFIFKNAGEIPPDATASDCFKNNVVAFMSANNTALGVFGNHAVCPVQCIERNTTTVQTS